MTLQLPVSEAMALIKQNSGRDINLSIVNSDTVDVGYTIGVNVPVIGYISKTFNINVTVDKVRNNNVFLHYSTGIPGNDTILNMVTSAMPVLSKEKMLQKQENGGLIVNLNEINCLRGSLNHIKINNLHFSNNNIQINFTPLL